MHCTKVNGSVGLYHNKLSCKRSQNERKQEIEYMESKRAFLDSNTETLTGLSLIALLCSIPLHGFKAGLEKKMSTKEKWGAGLILLSLALSLTADLKKIRLSKEYDKENKK